MGLMKSNGSYRSVALLAITTVCLAAITRPAWGESESKTSSKRPWLPAFDTLLAAVEAAGLVQTLKGPGPFTVLLRTTRLSSVFPKERLRRCLNRRTKSSLERSCHTTWCPVRSPPEAFGLNNAATVNGQRFDIAKRDGKLTVGSANIIATDINCSNGVIHVIDQVLLPEQTRIPAVAEKAGQFSTLLAAVSAAGLAEVLNGDGPFTVFAPRTTHSTHFRRARWRPC